LDVSVLHRSPDNLSTTITHSLDTSVGEKIQINFPLLNKGEFFVVKLLLSGRLETKNIKFSILADDIQRSLRPRRLPPDAISNKKYKIEWGLAIASLFILLIPIWACYILHSLWVLRPSLFVYPWKTFIFDGASIFVMSFGALFLFIATFMGAGMLLAALFNGQFPPRRGPHFPLPKELQGLFSPIGGLFDDEDSGAFKIEKDQSE